MSYLERVFFGNPALGWLEIALRGLLVYLVLNFLVRIMGQREIQQLTAVDFIVGITIGSIFAAALSNPSTSLWPALISSAVIVVVKMMITFLGIKNQRFARWTGGEPVTLIKDGKIQEAAMGKGLVNVDSLMEQLRKNKAYNLADVEFAVLEPSGSISVMKKSESQPVTKKDLQVGVGSSWYPAFLVKEGQIRHDNLKEVGLSETWLRKQLDSMGVTDLSEVFVAQISTTGSLYVDTYEDKVPQKKSISKDLILSQVGKLSEDLAQFAQSADEQQAKQLYDDLSRRARNVHSSLAKIWADKVTENKQSS